MRKASRKRRLNEAQNDEDERAEAAAVRSKTLPFMDSMMKVNETLRIHETFRDKINTAQILGSGASVAPEDVHSVDVGSMSVEPARSIGPALITAHILRRRYPRFCSDLSMTEEMVADVQPRSDVWLMHMIESTYDDAMEASYKAVSSARKRKRCGLQLGALDAFSLVATRLIARMYR